MADIIEFKYKKALEEHKLQESDLPSDAKVGIAQINSVIKALNMREGKGKKPTESVLSKLKTFDKWVYYEILDFVNDTDKNTEEAPVEVAEIIEEIKADDKAPAPADKKDEPIIETKAIIDPNDAVGIEVEAELEAMHKQGKKEWSIEEVKSIAKKTYNILFDSYDEGGENGIKTSKHSLIETSPKVFTLN